MITPEPKGTEPGYYCNLHRMAGGHGGSRLKDGSYRVKSILDTELGNPDALLARGKEFARTTDSAAGRGCLKKRMPAGNG